jgi:hypothetical protein
MNIERFNEWTTELRKATEDRIRRSIPGISNGEIGPQIAIRIMDVRKYQFVTVGPKPRFAVAMDGTIYGISSNDVNKKVCYGNVDTFEEYEWMSYYPVRKALYEWQATTQKTTANKTRKKTRKRPMACKNKVETSTNPSGVSKPPRNMYTHGTRLGKERNTRTRDRSKITENQD